MRDETIDTPERRELISVLSEPTIEQLAAGLVFCVIGWVLIWPWVVGSLRIAVFFVNALCTAMTVHAAIHVMRERRIVTHAARLAAAKAAYERKNVVNSFS